MRIWATFCYEKFRFLVFFKDTYIQAQNWIIKFFLSIEIKSELSTFMVKRYHETQGNMASDSLDFTFIAWQ